MRIPLPPLSPARPALLRWWQRGRQEGYAGFIIIMALLLFLCALAAAAAYFYYKAGWVTPEAVASGVSGFASVLNGSTTNLIETGDVDQIW